MNKLDIQYLALLQDILVDGVEKKDRTGVGTKSLFGTQIRHKMSDGFPILTTKKVYWKGVVEELLWFLRGETNIQSLVKQGVNIWVGDAYKAYVKSHYDYSGKLISIQPIQYSQEQFVEKIKKDDAFAKQFGELGPIYGSQWRKWDKETINTASVLGQTATHFGTRSFDQIANLIKDLKTNPDSRRLMVTAWNPSDLDSCVLPPCHYGFQCWTKELTAQERWNYYTEGKHGHRVKLVALRVYDNEGDNKHIHDWLSKWAPWVPTRSISLLWNQRSCDFVLGIPFNIASYGLLLSILAKEVNMVPDELIGNLGDTHIYLNHQEAVMEQLNNKGFELPKLNFGKKNIEDYQFEDFQLIDYKSDKTIKAQLNT